MPSERKKNIATYVHTVAECTTLSREFDFVFENQMNKKKIYTHILSEWESKWYRSMKDRLLLGEITNSNKFAYAKKVDDLR